ncbi:MAG: metallophosphatase [Flavobacteriales bacterium]|nr:metallophosphatase [Flavobacteriales bacterium]MCW8912991.1 metallophosphatase [Flavobacteriales bacterium]MCW8938999.1 metallophosphatase [Flavobacteriales bacterium]MCW8969166.1 metallophosphatase [Flavobacteriales bacterium]MCW8988992.1 metallophosphatase [Flavobacteriales bacterium]
MSNRRTFIKQSFLGGVSLLGAATLNPFSAAILKKNHTKITILHTNDVHSHIESFPSNDPKYPNMGGAAKRAALIDKIRTKEKNVLLLDAGDIFQGTPYFNMYGGELEFKLMSLMRYDAATIGNHDFDNGIEGLNNMLPHANFPFLNVNYDFTNTILNGKIAPYKVFEKDKVKIGVFGVGVELAGLVDKKMYAETQYNNPIIAANNTAEHLKYNEKCHLIICLSHLGYDYKSNKVSDNVLAKETKNIDLIIGGHTHTFLEKPASIKNKDNKITLINQVGWAGLYLGRIDFYINPLDKAFTSINDKIGVI